MLRFRIGRRDSNIVRNSRERLFTIRGPRSTSKVATITNDSIVNAIAR
jgi:hypothetical protein